MADEPPKYEGPILFNYRPEGLLALLLTTSQYRQAAKGHKGHRRRLGDNNVSPRLAENVLVARPLLKKCNPVQAAAQPL